ncbi:hypothetical protein RF11_04713 [Thelohanellus kitauei]|uniref:Uncharacterized protein n=1 Tax=Thelohanellus kitauei TaxID=669202 RepID=A0A0C2M0B8_THEKT|nr:hypothetical protein RF11_04713 [Thelohanellus kitauei]
MPLIKWNGYEVIIYSFAQLDSQICAPQHPILDKQSKYADYCLSRSNLSVDLDYKVRIFAFFKHLIDEWILDYKGHYIPAAFMNEYLLPTVITENDTISYELKGRLIYLSRNAIIDLRKLHYIDSVFILFQWGWVLQIH